LFLVKKFGGQHFSAVKILQGATFVRVQNYLGIQKISGVNIIGGLTFFWGQTFFFGGGVDLGFLREQAREQGCPSGVHQYYYSKIYMFIFRPLSSFW
jgi:hypothetical protein